MDSLERNAEFRAQERLEFRLESDPTKQLVEALGILIEEHAVAARVTYLLDRDGTIERVWDVGRGEAIDAHPDQVLAHIVGHDSSSTTP